ncbi:YopT-type cysteine protease domain-containing protein [Pseudomonas tolaasii]|nr:YopT-type cysteine protease domain-containing protein [Pseudomonas tolaasii]PKA73812.1 virulence surface antigen [Pseudomonas tolaasii NCPPB 2192]WLH51243.1 YopT-type cysteine protease domain-containing protein [Pseudomonas tolaasii]
MPANYVSWKTPIGMKVHRVAKFKQRSALSNNAAIKEMPGVQNGACIGLAFAWLRRRLQQPSETPQRRIQYLGQEDTLYKVDVDCSSFNRCYYRSARGIERIVAAAPNICGMSSRSAIEASGLTGLEVLASHIDETLPGYYLWECTFTEGVTSHAFALYADGSGMSFFDPNSGEYRIGAKGKLAFFKQLYNHYRHYVSMKGVKADLQFDKLFLIQLGNM